MMNQNPCNYCERKGCGAYHDVCKDHQEWKQLVRQKKENTKKTNDAINEILKENNKEEIDWFI